MRAKRIRQEGQLDTWQLQSDDGTIDFKYNKRLQSIRINSQERKVYFIEEKGLFFSHLIFANEYSQPVGDLFFDNPQHLTGVLSTQREKFRFQKTVTRVLLYDRKKNLLGSIQLDERMVFDGFEFAAILFAFVNYRNKVAAPRAVMA